MNIISTRTHGVIDYIVGVVLILAPWLFGFADGGPAMNIPIILGAGTIIYSLITAYELGAADVISVPTHLWIDGIAGFFLAVSPWLFGFADTVFLPHLLVGLLEIGTALMTEHAPRAHTSRSAV